MQMSKMSRQELDEGYIYKIRQTSKKKCSGTGEFFVEPNIRDVRSMTRMTGVLTSSRYTPPNSFNHPFFLHGRRLLERQRSGRRKWCNRLTMIYRAITDRDV